MAEGGFADFKVCNERDEQVATFGFADEHEARIARALMIRAISKAVLIVAYRTVSRQTGDRDEQFHALRQLLLSSPGSKAPTGFRFWPRLSQRLVAICGPPGWPQPSHRAVESLRLNDSPMTVHNEKPSGWAGAKLN